MGLVAATIHQFSKENKAGAEDPQPLIVFCPPTKAKPTRKSQERSAELWAVPSCDRTHPFPLKENRIWAQLHCPECETSYPGWDVLVHLIHLIHFIQCCFSGGTPVTSQTLPLLEQPSSQAQLTNTDKKNPPSDHTWQADLFSLLLLLFSFLSFILQIY